MNGPDVGVQKMTGCVQISQELLDDVSGVADVINDALRRALSGEPGVFKPLPPAPTVDDLFDEWSDGFPGLAFEAARAAFKAGYEAGYDRGAWENS